MAPKSLPMMPWYPRDFRSATLGWPLVARGVYRELLDAQWDLGELPTDVERLRMIANATPQEWAVSWPLIEPKLPLNCSGRKNQKLEEHRSKALEIQEKRSAMASAAGRASAQQRARGRSTKRQRTVEPTVNHPSPSPSPSPEPTPLKNSSAAARPDGGEFSRFRLTYPARAGAQPWRRALSAINARLQEGHSWTEIVEGAARYAAYVIATGKLNTEMTMQAATFCGPDKHFLQPWTFPAALPHAGRKTYADYDRESEARLAALPGEDPGPL